MFLPGTAVLLILAIHIQHTRSCLCKLIKFKCPAPPTCCESGQYALDECGCCLKCAKAELQTCGGANDISGRCGSGLQCLKTCLPCKTVGDKGKPCIFPFEYSGRTYDKCTTRDSDSGQPWCATAVDDTGYVVDNAWGDCLDGCPGTRVECDDKYFSIQEGKCIDVSVPGAIPNWFGAPAVKLLSPTQSLVTAPVCRTKGAVVRLYANTCRCVRGETAVDYNIRTGVARGNCTGLEDDATDNLDKVWCFLENIRDPLEPKSGCYSDTRWSERDGRFWSSLACFQAPDIEGGNNPAVHPGSFNRNRDSSQRNSPRKSQTTRQTTQPTTQHTTTTTEPVHTFDFTSDYEYSDYEEYYDKTGNAIAANEDQDMKKDRGFVFIPGETNLPGFERNVDVSDVKVEDGIFNASVFGPQPSHPAESNMFNLANLNNDSKERKDTTVVYEDLLKIQPLNASPNLTNVEGNKKTETTEYEQDTVDIENVTETIEIDIFDDLDELINEINEQNTNIDGSKKLDQSKKDLESSITDSVKEELNSLFKDVIHLNIRNLTTNESIKHDQARDSTIKSTRQRKQRPKQILQMKDPFKQLTKPDTIQVTNDQDLPKDQTIEAEIDSLQTQEVTTAKTPKRKQKPRKRSQKNKQRKISKTQQSESTNSHRIEKESEKTETVVGPQSPEEAVYELYTEQDLNSQTTTTTPDFFFGININL